MDSADIQRVAVVATGVIGASWTACFLARGLDQSTSLRKSPCQLVVFSDEWINPLSSLGGSPTPSSSSGMPRLK